jgi:hypothetical protein
MPQSFTLPKGERSLSKLFAFLSALSKEKAWKIEVAEYRKRRSDEQNSSLWGVAYPPITAATGVDAEDLHHIMCERYFGVIEYTLLGKNHTKPRRTTTRDESGRRSLLSTVEFMEFYAYVQRTFAEQGIYVPDPGEEMNDVA